MGNVTLVDIIGSDQVENLMANPWLFVVFLYTRIDFSKHELTMLYAQISNYNHSVYGEQLLIQVPISTVF